MFPIFTGIYTIEEFTILFKEGAAKFPSITEKPSNNNLERLQEVLTKLLQAAGLPGGTEASGIIINKVNCIAALSGVPFNFLDTPLEAYDPTIVSDAMSTNCVQAEHEWTEKLLRQRLLRAAERGACALILGAVKDTWVRRLKYETIY